MAASVALLPRERKFASRQFKFIAMGRTDTPSGSNFAMAFNSAADGL